ncbi:hypothetical protein EDB83DRAFT_1401645 [Lactarius deliciosus]|nr:hypothetical protein EDB83DRAFT_1401645 [Lactarius deliciosus]
MYVNWREAKAPPCMPTYSKSFSIGPSHNSLICRRALKCARGGKKAKSVVRRSSVNLPLLVHLISFSRYQIRPRSCNRFRCFRRNRSTDNVVQMLAGAEIDALSWPPDVAIAPLAGATVSELVGQLAAEGAAGLALTASEAVAAPAFDPAVLAQLANSIPQEQLQQLAQMFAAQPPLPQTQQQDDQPGWDTQTPAAFPADAGMNAGTPRDRWPPMPDDPKWGSGGSGRGRGRGRPLDGVRQFRSRTACSFYAQGRCKYGDQCNFSHDQGFS